MSMHINRFVDSIKAHEARQQRDFVMSMRDAKDLHADITKLLLVVQQLQARTLDQQQDSVVSVEVHGGSF
jgi:hypothetical protein